MHRYEGQVHGLHGWLVLLCAAAISTLDVISLVRRAVSYGYRVHTGEQKFAIRSCWNTVVLDREEAPLALGGEYAGLVSEDPEELDMAELKAHASSSTRHSLPHIDTTMSPIEEEEDQEPEQWANDVRGHSRNPSYPQSAMSERTVFEPHSPRGSVHSVETLHTDEWHPLTWIRESTRPAILLKIGRAVFATSERILVFLGLMQVVTGIVIYTGGCRENYINGCLAHLISESPCLIPLNP